MTEPSVDCGCPRCAGEMTSYERNGVTVDQCSECRGGFLDRGELDRVIGAESRGYASSSESAPSGWQQGDHHGGGYGRSEEHGGGRREEHGGRHQPRRRGFLGELFD